MPFQTVVVSLELVTVRSVPSGCAGSMIHCRSGSLVSTAFSCRYARIVSGVSLCRRREVAGAQNLDVDLGSGGIRQSHRAVGGELDEIGLYDPRELDARE